MPEGASLGKEPSRACDSQDAQISYLRRQTGLLGAQKSQIVRGRSLYGKDLVITQLEPENPAVAGSKFNKSPNAPSPFAAQIGDNEFALKSVIKEGRTHVAQHRATGRAHVRPLAAGKGARRNSQVVSASAVKVSMLGALATATIAAPLASAAADQGTAAPVEAQALSSTIPAAAPQAAAPLTLPAADAKAAPVQYSNAVSTGALKATAPVIEETVATEAATAAGDDTADAASEASDVQSAGYVKPTPGAPVTSSFGYRIHPTLGYRKMHDGVDFGAACGTPVHAVADGTAIAVEYHPASGNRVKVKHANGDITDYYHLSEFAVSQGQKIEKGTVVGSVGSTGRSTGCHLHFGLEKGEGNYVNPMTLWQ